MTPDERTQETQDNLQRIRILLDHINKHPELLIATRGQHTNHRTTFGHAAPANLDLMNLTDTRTGVPKLLEDWTRRIRAARGFQPAHARHYLHTTGFLHQHTPWAEEHLPDSPCYHADIRNAHRKLAAQLGPITVQSEQSPTGVPENSEANP